MVALRCKVISSKKEKIFYRIIKKWLSGEDIDEVELAIELSSMLTHSLIEVKGLSKCSLKDALAVASDLEIEFQSESINRLVTGEVSGDELRNYYLARFGEAFDIR